MQLDIGTVISISTFVLTMGITVGLLQAMFKRLIEKIGELGAALSLQTDVTREVTAAQSEIARLLLELTVLHTPERADGAGFGTVEIRTSQLAFKHDFDLFRLQYTADIEKQGRDHAEIMERLGDVVHRIAELQSGVAALTP